MRVEDKKFWHELSQDDIDKLVAENKNWGYVLANFKQPDWCEYTNALNGKMGCWSLTDISNRNVSENFCKDCDCYTSIYNDNNKINP